MEARKWKMSEFAAASSASYANPFWDVQVRAEFVHPASGTRQSANAYYDGLDDTGSQCWKVRWTPVHEGSWLCRIWSVPANEQLEARFQVEALPAEEGSKGFLRADTEASYGFRFDNGEPYFLFGDTMYNVFGAHYCDVDVESIFSHRKSQGVNYIRARLQVSPYHPEVANQWQTKDLWPWGGSAQMPVFTKLNLAYFKAVDEVVAMGAKLGIGFEMIPEGWLFEFPFNDRGKFLPEYEAFWNSYIVARYAAFSSVYIWCPANEYEFYPLGTPGRLKESNRWFKGLTKQIRGEDPYAHPIGAHNWEKVVPLHERLGDCETVDVFLVQTEWGTETEKWTKDASLCIGIESDMKHHFGTGNKVCVCAEFGYERAEGLLTAGGHQRMDHHHTRRGQWRAGFSGYAVVHGFDNTWGAHMRLDKDPIGAAYLPLYYRFMTETLRFDRLAPSPESLLSASGSEKEGTLPLCLRDAGAGVTAVYFPATGFCELPEALTERASFQWYNPRTGQMNERERCERPLFTTPESAEGTPGGDDWVLLVEAVQV
ncbi:apiosidase-like domain-containing protein [Paenibacillus silvisoli]|uniref:apiosidase-like domain-containing protein n=1 Tax=Paenibacillus silvisoli TaxID=3110539 RepID=UPI002805D4F7|nr:DUF4038 domain-containing protein [Paenibacillus silvisoli]